MSVGYVGLSPYIVLMLVIMHRSLRSDTGEYLDDKSGFNACYNA